ncbi:MAG TPA: hypothetical protein VKU41_30250 [Polyangiaceae bacterium]|nr:hypothetical protein [Polyangiaceae bacterium]
MPLARARLTISLALAAVGWTAACGIDNSGSGPRPGGSHLDAGAGSDDSGGDDGASDGAPASTADAAMVPFICDTSSMNQLCTIRTIPAPNAMAMQSQCMQTGGTVVMACPTAKLVGCCTEPDREECQYAPTYDSTSAPTGCMRILGTWSTSP